jgi:hypothetical protein
MEAPKSNLLEKYISPLIFSLVHDLSHHPVYVYKHVQTGLPMACVAGGHAGDIIGGIFWFRDVTNSINMEMEVTMDMIGSSLVLIEKMIGKPIESTLECVWSRFMNNLIGRLSQKKGFTSDGTSVPLVQEEEEEEEVLEPSPKEARVDECMICMTNPPDTTVFPCMHSVVCSSCSVNLENTGDNKICCQCRCPITGVYYPDNTLKEK